MRQVMWNGIVVTLCALLMGCGSSYRYQEVATPPVGTMQARDVEARVRELKLEADALSGNNIRLQSQPGHAYRRAAAEVELYIARAQDTKLRSERKQFLKEIQEQFTKALAGAQTVLDALGGEANRNSNLHLSVGLLGIASTIAAGALVVASPANAVWVAALAATATGTTAFQTRLQNEGYSRSAIIELHTAKQTAINKHFTDFGNAVEAMTTFLEDDAKWNAAAGKASKVVILLQGEALSPGLAVSTSETTDPETMRALKATMDELLKQMLDDRTKRNGD